MASTLKPEVGDLIEISRSFYKHWAVYVGDGYVTHLASSDVPEAGSNSMMSVTANKAIVKKEGLKDVVGSNQWKINNTLDKQYKPRPADVIVKQACAMVGRSVAYDVLSGNCEHFANVLRYGKAESRQAQEVGETLTVLGVFAAGVTSIVGLVWMLVPRRLFR